jgi:xanthine dehydrogenase small subunit
MKAHPIELSVNAKLCRESEVKADTTLLTWLRECSPSLRTRLLGTKEGCAEGDCGACCVLVRPMGSSGPFEAQHSCIRLVASLHRHEIITVEGLESCDANGDLHLHPVQAKMVEENALQCGFCTPGFVMTLVALHQDPKADDASKLAHLAGNLCRCTGYTGLRRVALHQGFAPHQRIPADFLAAAPSLPAPQPVYYCGSSHSYFAPLALADLFDYWRRHPSAKIVAGATDLALLLNLEGEPLPELIDLTRIEALAKIEVRDGQLELGACLSVEATRHALYRHFASTLGSACELLDTFASPAIRNVATLGGNLCTASPIGDLAPLLLALDARVELCDANGRRTFAMHEFFVGRRQTVLKAQEILVKVMIPTRNVRGRVITHKISRRREVDISSLSAAFYVEYDDASGSMTARLAFGGMAAIACRAGVAESILQGGHQNAGRDSDGKIRLDLNVFAAAAASLATTFTPVDDHRASAWYRGKVAQNLVIDLARELRS